MNAWSPKGVESIWIGFGPWNVDVNKWGLTLFHKEHHLWRTIEEMLGMCRLLAFCIVCKNCCVSVSAKHEETKLQLLQQHGSAGTATYCNKFPN